MTTPSASWSQRIVVLSLMWSLSISRWTAFSDALDDGGDPHAAADAERGQPVAAAGALELVDERAEDHRPGGAEWMAHRDRAAIDVDLVDVGAHVLDEPQHDRGEGLV